MTDKVVPALRTELDRCAAGDAPESVPVVVQLEPGADTDRVAEALRTAGATQVRPLALAAAVAAVAGPSAVAAAARLPEVRRIVPDWPQVATTT